MKKALQAINNFIMQYPLVAIGIVCSLFVAIWWFFFRKSGGFSGVENRKSNLRNNPGFYLNIADQVYRAMIGLGTNEDAIFKALDGLNSDELIEVFNQYGYRSSDADFAWVDNRVNLIEALRGELSGDDLERVKVMFVNTGLWN